MRKSKSIYRILIALLLMSLLIPIGAVGAQVNGGDNAGPKGKLTIHKYEQEAGTERGDGDGTELGGQLEGELLPGVTYEIIQTHEFNPETDEWRELGAGEGVTFTEVTDQDGQIVIDPIPLGRYSVEEIDGPDYVNLHEEIFYVDIPMTNKAGTEVNYDVHIYPKNETIRGAVVLTKINGDTQEPIEGVLFHLYSEDGLEHDDLVTDHNGNIVVNGLSYGDYYFKEVATVDGYVLGNPRVEFSITKDGVVDSDGGITGTVEGVEIKNFVEPDIVKEVDSDGINRGGTVTYSLTIDLPGDISEYKEFIITDDLDNRLTYVDGSWEANGLDQSHIDFEQQGQLLTWTLQDFTTISGPSQFTITFDAKVAEDAAADEVINNKATIEFENQFGHGGEKETGDVPLTPTDGGVKIIKVDGKTGETLQGAIFELTDEAGNVIDATGTIIEVNGTAVTGLLNHLTSDAHGEIVITGLNVGTYYLVETKAPFYDDDGVTKSYRMLTKPVTINIVDGETDTIEVKNYKSGWDLPKTGGIGTVLFTVTGLTLMASALVVGLRRRKVDA